MSHKRIGEGLCALILILTALLVFSPSDGAAPKMARYQDVVQDVRGSVVGGAKIYVYRADTDTLATIYATPYVTGATIANPLTSTSSGRFGFYAANGFYDLLVSKSGSTSYRLEDVAIQAPITGAAAYVPDTTAPTLSNVNASISCSGGVARLTATANVSERARLFLSYRRNQAGWSLPIPSTVYAYPILTQSYTTVNACTAVDTFRLRVGAQDSAGNVSAYSAVSILALDGGGVAPNTPIALVSPSAWWSLSELDSIQITGQAKPIRNGNTSVDTCRIFTQYKWTSESTWHPVYPGATVVSNETGWSTMIGTTPYQTRQVHSYIYDVLGDTLQCRMRLRLASGDTTPTAWSPVSTVGVMSIGNIRVDSVTGSAIQDSIITITGVGFGTKSTAAPLRSFDFEGSTFLPGGPIPDQGSGGFITTTHLPGYLPVISTARPRGERTKSLYQNCTGGNSASGISLQGLFNGKIYLSGWFYRTTSGNPTRNFKWIQLRPVDLNEYIWEFRQDSYPSTSSGHIYVSNCSGGPITGCNDEIGMSGYTPENCNMYYGMSGDLKTDAWHRYEIWLDQGTQGLSDGQVRISLDGLPWMSMDGPFNPAGCLFDNMWLAFYFATDTGSPVPSMETWWDEIYVDDTRARVEIGNDPVYASDACNHREILTPITWTDSQITAKFNAGSFVAGDPVWLFVINPDGNVSSSAVATALSIGSVTTGGTGGGTEITLASLASTYACDSGDTKLVITATASEDSVWLWPQYRASGQPVWSPAFSAGDTAGVGPMQDTSISKQIDIGTACNQGYTGSPYEVRSLVYDYDLNRVSTTYNFPAVTIPDPATILVGAASYSLVASPSDSIVVTVAVTPSTSAKMFSQVKRYYAGADTGTWRPLRNAATNWSLAEGTSLSQVRSLGAGTGFVAADSSVWVTRAMFTTTMEDTTGWAEVDTFMVLPAVQHKYFLTRNSSEDPNLIGQPEEYTAIYDTTQIRTGWLSTYNPTLGAFGSSPFGVLLATVSSVAVFNNSNVAIPVMYFSTAGLTDFAGATVDTAILHITAAGNMNQSVNQDTLFFVGADADSQLAWGGIPQYKTCMNRRGPTLAWPSAPSTWTNFADISTLARGDQGLIGNQNMVAGAILSVDVTAYYQALANIGADAEKFNGGIWMLNAVGHPAQGVSTYRFHSGTSATVGSRPVLEIWYTK